MKSKTAKKIDPRKMVARMEKKAGIKNAMPMGTPEPKRGMKKAAKKMAKKSAKKS